jgi:hypothetical protein
VDAAKKGLERGGSKGDAAKKSLKAGLERTVWKEESSGKAG